MRRALLRMKAWMMDYAYLVTLGAVIAVIAGSAIYTQQVKKRSEALVQAAADAPKAWTNVVERPEGRYFWQALGKPGEGPATP